MIVPNGCASCRVLSRRGRRDQATATMGSTPQAGGTQAWARRMGAVTAALKALCQRRSPMVARTSIPREIGQLLHGTVLEASIPQITTGSHQRVLAWSSSTAPTPGAAHSRAPTSAVPTAGGFAAIAPGSSAASGTGSCDGAPELAATESACPPHRPDSARGAGNAQNRVIRAPPPARRHDPQLCHIRRYEQSAQRQRSADAHFR
jgi:hypothetical protein